MWYPASLQECSLFSILGYRAKYLNVWLFLRVILIRTIHYTRYEFYQQGIIVWKKNVNFTLTLIIRGGGHNYHPLSENRDFAGTKPPLDLRPVCKLKFVHFGRVEKTRVLFLSPRILKKNSQETSSNARGLIFCILALYISKPL